MHIYMCVYIYIFAYTQCSQIYFGSSAKIKNLWLKKKESVEQQKKKWKWRKKLSQNCVA